MATIVFNSFGEPCKKGTKFEVGDTIRCLDIPRTSPRENGYNIHPGDDFVVLTASHMHNGEEIVELEEDSDGVPCTFYPVKFFEKV